MRNRKQLLLPACCTCLIACGIHSNAWGQYNLVDQTRSLTANATGTASEAGLFDSGPAAGVQSLNTDTTTITGNYSNLLNGTKTDSPNDGSGDISTFNVSSSAQQTSVVSNSIFSATSSVGASAILTPIQGGTDFSADGYGQSTYSADFTVATPTPFSLSGDITGDAIYHLGRLESIAANITFLSNSTPLYSTSFAPTGYTTPGESFDDPIAFSTMLEPGQTYTLSAAASVDSGRAGVGLTSIAPASAGYSFSASVPEPASLVLLPAVWLLMRRSRSTPIEPRQTSV